MRRILAICCICMAGCASSPFSLAPRPEQPMALLKLGARSGHPASLEYNGIWSVDNRNIPGGPVQSIWVAPGKHTIGYICPGIVVFDGYQTASQDFVASERYEISCEDESGIKVARDGA
jgi:hypothetical protein